MSVTAPIDSASPSIATATVRQPVAAQHPAVTVAVTVAIPAAEPVDLVSLSSLAVRHLALEPPIESLRQLDGLLHDLEEIEQVVRAPSPAAIGSLAVEIAAAVDQLAAQVPRPIVAPAKPDAHADGQPPGTPHHPSNVFAEREQRLRDDATSMLGRAADTLERLQPDRPGTPVEMAILAASTARVARARARLAAPPSDMAEPVRPRPPLPGFLFPGLLLVAALLLAVLVMASRVDLHVARLVAGGLVVLCIGIRLCWQWPRRSGLREREGEGSALDPLGPAAPDPRKP